MPDLPVNPTPDPDLDPSRMPLWEHLEELRLRLFYSVIGLAVGFCVTYAYSDWLILWLEKPLLNILPEGQKHLYFTGITDKFVVYLQVSLLAAVALMSPFLFYQLWRFVSPALRDSERRFVFPFVIFASFSFLSGLAFAYYIVVPYGYEFLLHFGGAQDQALITLTEYFSLTLKLLLAIGVIFEVPVVLVLLGKVGIVNDEFLRQNRRYAVVASAVVAAIATPSPDAFTMLIVMAPLYLLYEISIVGVKWVYPKPS